jgi:hypothetical protein
MSIPAIIIASVVLPCLIILLWELFKYPSYSIVLNHVDSVTFALYAGAVAYFRGKKIWHKIIIFATVFVVQFFVLLLIAVYAYPYPEGF